MIKFKKGHKSLIAGVRKKKKSFFIGKNRLLDSSWVNNQER